MSIIRRGVLTSLILLATLAPAAVRAAEPAALLPGNMLSNPGFEYDWHNNGAEGHVLAFMGDWSFNASDTLPDYWTIAGGFEYTKAQAHSGQRSLMLKPGASAALGVIKAAVRTTASGGGDRRWGNPPPGPIAYEPAVRLARTARASVWYKPVDTAGGTITLAIGSCNFSKTETATADAPGQWKRLDLVLTRQEIEQAFAENKAKGVQADLSLKVTVAGGAGIYIDDVSLAEDTEDPNLAANSSFENVEDKSTKPKDWTGPHKYNWYTQQYYKWTSWNHFFSEVRGTVGVTDLAAHTGSRSLLMQVYPGGEMLVEGQAVVLNQDKPGIIEIGAYVLLDRMKWIDIRAVDEDGNEILCADPFGGGWPVPQDKSQRYPSNTAEWTYVRKTFFSTKPLKLIRPRLCARGFNGDTRDDGGTRPNVNQVGLAFWDDVRVSEITATADELKARGVKLPGNSEPKSDALVIGGIDMGERLFGENAVTLQLANPTKKEIEAELSLSILDADGKPTTTTKTKVKVPANDTAPASLGYTLGAAQMQGHWKTQGLMRLELTVKKDTRTADLAYNTWPVIVDVDLYRHYPTPEENPQNISINLGVSAATLAKAKHLSIDICHRTNNKVVQSIPVPDLQKAFADTLTNIGTLTKPQFDGTPSPVQFADRKNLIAISLDLSKLPVHPFDYPIRDHYLRIRGLDGSGKEIFADSSQPFGRVAPNTEVLPAISSTKISQDGAVLINDKPVFLMAGNSYTTGHYSINAEVNKKMGFNSIRWVENVASASNIWKVNLYSLETMISKGAVTEDRLTKMQTDLAKWKEEKSLDGVITMAAFYEHSSDDDTLEQIELQKRYTKIANSFNRISNFGAGGAHNIYTLEKAFDAYDSFGLEIEPFGPPRGGYELAPLLRKGGKAWFHLPQTYNTTPFEFFRFDIYNLIVQGGRGFSTIHGLGDPSFMRGITGEVRHLSPAIFSLDHGDLSTTITPGVWLMQRKVDKTTTIIAINKPAVEIGDWTWHDDAEAPGGKSHSGISGYMPLREPDGLRVHGFRETKPLVIEKGDRIVQYVWLDPKNTPKSITWGVRGDAKWDFNAHYGQAYDFKKWRAEYINFWLAGELLAGTWQIDWQYNDSTRDWFADNIMNEKSFRVKGELPKPGTWTRLEVSAEELGLVGQQIDGFMFIAKDGDSRWTNSLVIRGDKEITFCGQTLGPSAADLAAVKISVPWAPDGTKVKVLFEERELVVKDGAFIDDFTGEDIFQTVRGGAVGDSLAWHPLGTKLKGQTLGYVTPSGKAHFHAYEIVTKK